MTTVLLFAVGHLFNVCPYDYRPFEVSGKVVNRSNYTSWVTVVTRYTCKVFLKSKHYFLRNRNILIN